MEQAKLGIEPPQAFGEGKGVLVTLLGRPSKLFYSQSNGCLVSVHPNHPIDQFQEGLHFSRAVPMPSWSDCHQFAADCLTSEVLEASLFEKKPSSHACANFRKTGRRYEPGSHPTFLGT